ncbi:MAG: PfkB family carbohydrate kinase [Chlamydiia bacterium]
MHDSSSIPWVDRVLKVLEAAPQGRLLVGCDGFIDRVVRVVEREGTPPICYETIRDFLGSVSPDHSSGYGLQVREERLGGNAPLLARGAAKLGLPTTLVSTLGWPQSVPMLASSLAGLPIDLHTIGDPGSTLALEFTNGKIMLGEPRELATLTLPEVNQRLQTATWATLLDQVSLMAWVNWTMTPWMEDLWAHLRDLKPPLCPMFIDLADPSRRGLKALEQAVRLLKEWPGPLWVGLNRKEAMAVASLAGSPRSEANLEELSTQCAKVLPHAHLVLHSRRGTVLQTQGTTLSMAVPDLGSPMTLTGAGDHFNAGLLAGLAYGLQGEALLGLACAYASSYVMTGESLTRSGFAKWLAEQVIFRDLPLR